MGVGLMEQVRSVYAVRANLEAQPFIAFGNLSEALKVVNTMHRDEEGFDRVGVWEYVTEIPVFGSFEVFQDE